MIRSRHPVYVVATIMVLQVAVFRIAEESAVVAQRPTLHDDRMELTLFAEDPEIVTPIGMAIDHNDHLFVIESHTHHPPSDYAGPKSDRIKRFRDEDNDGHSDGSTIFADGIDQAMNLAFSPDGELFVVCAREVIRLIDADADGKCERQETVLSLDTQERYAHNSWLGITFDRDGWMYLARGNTGSHHYRIEGPDGSFVEGYGDGGNIIRCRSDGSQVSEFSTGFWNPFDLKFDRNGRLLVVDNDPDARGPNRLLQAVRGGDYGYRSLYGGSGNHPFQGWDGDLPGTLPYLAGTGEAPCSVLDCRRASLPVDYAGSVLAAIWNENSIERFELRVEEDAAGKAELTATARQPFLSGSKNFRPVALECDSRGNLFITDWVLVDYPNHGRGRIWRIATQTATDRMTPESYFDEYHTGGDRIAQRDRAATTPEKLADAYIGGDAFVRHAITQRLSEVSHAELRRSWRSDTKSDLRLASLIASRRADVVSADVMANYLSDPDLQVRRAALLWAGDPAFPLETDLTVALSSGPVDATLLDTYLAAEANRQRDFLSQYRNRANRRANRLTRDLPFGLVLSIAQDAGYSTAVRRLAIERLSDAELASATDWIRKTIENDAQTLAIAGIRRVARESNGFSAPLLETIVEIALAPERSPRLRCEALLVLADVDVASPDRFVQLLHDANEDVAIEAARLLRAWIDTGGAKERLAEIEKLKLRDAVAERLAPAMARSVSHHRVGTERPASPPQWFQAVGQGGDPERGRRVFFTKRNQCAKCHSIGGGGQTLGPDLAQVGRSKTRRQIIEAILDPSAEFAPQYQAWLVITTDGRVHRGLQLDHKAGGKIVLTLDDGTNRTFADDEIEDYAASPSSLMPAGLVDSMTVGEFRDLVAFLAGSGE